MKPKPFLAAAIFLFLMPFLFTGLCSPQEKFPYREAGLTPRQAAAHLLNRLTFGPRPGEIDRVVQMGLENWFESQLEAQIDDHKLQNRLSHFRILSMSAQEIARTYPNPGLILAQAVQEGVISRQDTTLSRDERRRILREFSEKKGYRPQRELFGAMMAQKLLRAVYSENQLAERLTNFWFNHFNVSLTDNQARVFILSYERDAIRPHVLGHFRELLEATARHPAMLLYLDNAQSTAPESVRTTMDLAIERLRNQPGISGRVKRWWVNQALRRQRRERQRMLQAASAPFRPRRGINENYARELMELHTLGVEGGYTQQDVIEVARALTGWTVYPPGPRGDRLRKRVERGKQVGFVRDGLFLFRADMHDAGEKVILGQKFAPGGGLDEGERVLDLLASHPSTARHIALKLATRFVSDTPPPALVNRLAAIFSQTGGDIKAMMRTLVQSPEFWSRETRRAKIKSPFELAVSALRALDANVRPTRQLIEWIRKMGQPLYAYQAPTGFPDRADFWINTGTLLNRMNFAMSLALGKIRGVRFDLLGLNQNREPESITAALETYAKILLPEWDASATLRRLQPIVHNAEFARKIEREARQENPKMLANVVGIILGSPEFQRH